MVIMSPTVRHGSISTFQEHSRLQALQALEALLTLLQRLPDSHALDLGSSGAACAARVLSSVMGPFLVNSLGGKLQPLGGTPLSWGELILDSICHMSQAS